MNSQQWLAQRNDELWTALRDNPMATPATLPDTTSWLGRFFDHPVTLQPDKPFIDQVFTLASDVDFDACHWDPYDEGYDEGPGDISDNWRAGFCISTGQFQGWDVSEHQKVFDPISASIAVALNDWDWNHSDAAKDIVREAFAEAIGEDWIGPRSQEERDKAVSKEIMHMAAGLSPAARIAVSRQLLTFP